MMPLEMVERVLGKNGIILWKKANGIDHSAVEAYSERKSISSETTFEQDTINIPMINDLLLKMVEKLSYQLRSKKKLTSCVTVKVRYANFDTHTLQHRIPYTAFDHKLLPVVRSLFNKLYQRRMLIRLIGIKFSYLVSGVQQINMFDDEPETISLYQAMDKIRNRYGVKAITRASTLGRNEDEEQTNMFKAD